MLVAQHPHRHCQAVTQKAAGNVQSDPAAEKAAPSESGDYLKGALWPEEAINTDRLTSSDTTDETIPGYSAVADTSDSERGEDTIQQFLAEDATMDVAAAEIDGIEVHEASHVCSAASDVASTASLEETFPQLLAEDSTMPAVDTAEIVCRDEHEALDHAFTASDSAFTDSDAGIVDQTSVLGAVATPSLPIVFEHHGNLIEVKFEKSPLGFEFGGKFVASKGKFVITKVVRPELRQDVKLGMLIKKVGDEATANLEYQDFAALLEAASKFLPEDA